MALATFVSYSRLLKRKCRVATPAPTLKGLARGGHGPGPRLRPAWLPALRAQLSGRPGVLASGPPARQRSRFQTASCTPPRSALRTETLRTLPPGRHPETLSLAAHRGASRSWPKLGPASTVISVAWRGHDSGPRTAPQQGAALAHMASARTGQSPHLAHGWHRPRGGGDRSSLIQGGRAGGPPCPLGSLHV